MTIGYLICFIASVGLLVAYTLLMKKREFWLTMLHVCVIIVNLGYFLTSIAKNVEFAIFGNDVTYLGSAFLCMCMLLTIIRLCGFEVKKAHVITCLSLGFIMFAIIASSPMIPLYYTSVDIKNIEGATKLVKEYGILHNVYLIYLLGYFTLMIVTIINSVRKKKIGKPKFAGFITAVVCSNIIVWLFEKLINWEYEFLSITYIVSELLLILVYWMMQDYILKSDVPPPVIVEEKAPIIIVDNLTKAEKIQAIISSLPENVTLSTRQIEILEMILDYKSRKEIAVELHLSENTVKTHTATLYKVLEVSSRDEIYAMFQK